MMRSVSLSATIILLLNASFTNARINDRPDAEFRIEEEGNDSGEGITFERKLVDRMGNYQLKMYWTQSYDWREKELSNKTSSIDFFEPEQNEEASKNNKEWCATCAERGCANGAVILKECDRGNPDQRWRESSTTKLKTHSNPNGCLSYYEPDRMTIKSCSSNNDSHQLVHLKQFSNGRVQIQAVNRNYRCMTPYAAPSDNDRLRLTSCPTAVDNQAAFWVKGTTFGGTGDTDDGGNNNHDDGGGSDNYDDDEGPSVGDNHNNDDPYNYDDDYVPGDIVTSIGKNKMLKLFWQHGYVWDGCKEDKRLCMQCSDHDCTRGKLIVKRCNQYEASQRFTSTSDGTIKSVSDPRYCLSQYNHGDFVVMRECDEVGSNDAQKVKIKMFDNDKFQIRVGKRCLTTYHHPSKDDPLKFVPCSRAVSKDASLWRAGKFKRDCGSIFSPQCFLQRFILPRIFTDDTD